MDYNLQDNQLINPNKRGRGRPLGSIKNPNEKNISSNSSINSNKSSNSNRGRPKIYLTEEERKQSLRENSKKVYYKNREKTLLDMKKYKEEHAEEIKLQKKAKYQKIKDELKIMRLIIKIKNLTFNDDEKKLLLQVINK